MVLPLFTAITSNINTTTVITSTTMPKGMKGKISKKMRGKCEPNQNTSSVCRWSKECNSNILGTVWCVELKLTGLVVRNVELTKRKYLHPNATASTHTTATVTIIITSITTTALKLRLLQLILQLLQLLLKLRIWE